MAPRKPKAPEFPAEVCGVCKFSEPCADKEGYLCWGHAPQMDGEGCWHRGSVVDPGWPCCALFQARMHG